jgi:hypothetical protein
MEMLKTLVFHVFLFGFDFDISVLGSVATRFEMSKIHGSELD